MQRSITKKVLRHAFWLSILLHLLLLATAVVYVTQPEEKEKPPNLYVPAYTYKGGITPTQQSVPIARKQTQMSQAKRSEKIEPTDKTGILSQSMLLSSYNVLQQEQRQSFTKPTDSEPIYMIGDTSEAPDPLVRLLGRALSANFSYPKVTGEFGMTGRTLVGMIVHPEGYLSNVQILQSSNNESLDAAALYATNSAPTIKGANKYISKPKKFMVYFVFR